MARAELDAAQRGVISAQRAYDDTISHPSNPASTIETAYDVLAAAKERVTAAQALYNKAAVFYAQYQPSIDTAEKSGNCSAARVR